MEVIRNYRCHVETSYTVKVKTLCFKFYQKPKLCRLLTQAVVVCQPISFSQGRVAILNITFRLGNLDKNKKHCTTNLSFSSTSLDQVFTTRPRSDGRLRRGVNNIHNCGYIKKDIEKKVNQFSSLGV